MKRKTLEEIYNEIIGSIPRQTGYSVHSKFDLEKHKKTYINYLEVVISPEGEVEYAVPSHQVKLETLACKKLNLSDRRELWDKCPQEKFADYNTWLSEITGYIMVWTDFYSGNANISQLEALCKLKKEGVYSGKLEPGFSL